MIYRPEIDGFRALAVIPVVFFHAGIDFFSGGFVGVDVFFVISGYLITTILIEDIDNNRFSLTNFYERRARRILPALYFVVFITFVASLITLYPQDLVSFAKSVIAIPFFSSNFFFWSERGYFDNTVELKPLVHTWSLAVEEQFYIVFPIFLLLLKKYKQVFYSLLFIIFFLSIGSSYYVTLIHFDTAFYFPFTRAWELIFGSFAALILRYKPFELKIFVAEFISVIGLCLIIFSINTFNSDTLFPYISASLPVLGAFLFIITSQNSYLIKNILSSRFIIFIGLISYSLYLWHQPIFAIARHKDFFEGNVEKLIALSIIISCISYFFIEKPFRKKNLISSKKILIYSISSSLILIIIGIFPIIKDGFPERYKKEDQPLLTQLVSYKGYNEKRFDSLNFKQFEKDSSYKIVIVGDSHAKDLLNIIAESKMFENYEFSTRQVNSDCGNLYLNNYDQIQKFIPDNRKERCKLLGRYGGKDFLKILNESDEIWIVGLWFDWVIELLPESIANLNKDFQKPLRIFGRKNFGKISPHSLLEIPYDKRPNYTQPVTKEALKISSILQQKLGDYIFYYSLLEPLCGGDLSECRIFTKNGLLMSADGGHLTQEGAIESVKRMFDILIDIKR